MVGCAGAIDGSTAARCDAVQAAMASFLPAVANITNERNACAVEHCSGHGRCVDYEGNGVRCACVEGWRGWLGRSYGASWRRCSGLVT